MRFIRVSRPDGPAFAALHADMQHAILLQGNPFSEYTLTDQIAPIAELSILPPVLPSKVLCAWAATTPPTPQRRGNESRPSR